MRPQTGQRMQHLTNQHNYPSMPTRHRSRHLDVLIIFGSVLFFILGEASGVIQGGMLYPQESESRQIQTLDGVWSFRADRSAQRNEGFLNSWWEKALSEVNVCLIGCFTSSDLLKCGLMVIEYEMS